MNNVVSGKFSRIDSKFSIPRMFRSLDQLQDIIVFFCGGLLVFKMMLIIVNIFLGLSTGMDIKEVTAQSLFLLILVELFRLVAVYLKTHRMYVSIAVELAIVSVIREIIVEGLIHMDAMLVFATCAFLVCMGALMLVSHKIDGHVDH